MAKPFGVWGIDIGQCALKALRMELIDGYPTATAFDYIEHPKILSQPDADPDALTRDSLEKFLSRNPLGKDQVAISIAGQSGLVRFVKLPPVEEKKVTDIVKFEAKQQIPFPLEEVVWDFQKIGGGETIGGFAMETEVGLFAMKRDIINKHLGHYRAVGAEVHVVQMAPLALCNFATYEILKKGGPDAVEGDVPVEGEDETPRGKKRCAVVLDIGTDSSNLIITDGGKIIWQRPIPLGGNHFTRALTKEMKLTFAKAEHLKRNAAKSAELAQILRALRPVLTEFVGEVQRSLGYFTNTHRDAHVAYLIGLGSAFRLPGLQKYLSEKLSIDVRKPSRINRLAGEQVLQDPTFTENILTFPVAYGLALQGLGIARLLTNLLPTEVRTERLIRAKKPAIAMAAAALLIGTAALAGGYGAKVSAVSDPKINDSLVLGEKQVEKAKTQDKDYGDKKTEIDKAQGEVKAIIVGNDERLNWIRFQEVLSAALPRHGDATSTPRGNLDEPQQVPFWNTIEGKRAVAKYSERMSQGIPLENLYDDDLTQHLANVSLESVYCRYTDNVGTFLTTADERVQKQFATFIADDMLESEREEVEVNAEKRKKPKAAEGGGWVVELRGFTYHKDGANFIRKGLIRNLQNADKFAAASGGDEKVAKIIPGGVDPVKGKISNVFVYLTQKDDTYQSPTTFKYIGASYLDELLGGGALPGGFGPGGPGPGGPGPVGPAGPGQVEGATPAAPAATPWTPANPPGNGTAGPGGSGAAFGGGDSGLGGRPSGPGAAPAPGDGGNSPAGPGGTPTATGARKPKARYEFVVYLVWREPTPTDPTPTAAIP